jgi:uncharacterized protein YbjQ (UPF0145 family)
MLEFAAIGTAVRETGAPPLGNAEPFVSSLSGQDHYSLRKIGYKPVGFAMGNCTWYQIANWSTQIATGGGFGSWYNQELTDFTQATYQSRELAMQRMEYEARTAGATGIVGVTVEPWYETYEVQNRHDLILHFTATGTCVAPDPPSTPTADPKIIVQLRD